VNRLQPLFHGDDEIQAPETHERARGPSSVVVGHPQPGGINKTHKRPLPGARTIGVSNRRLVSLCLRVWLGWCATKAQGFRLVRVGCPYVHFGLLIFLHFFAIGLPSLWWRSVVQVRECLRVRSPYGDPPFPFYKPRGNGRIPLLSFPLHGPH
jgi:hypothetical protein